MDNFSNIIVQTIRATWSMNCEDVLSLTKIKDKNVLSVYIDLSILK